MKAITIELKGSITIGQGDIKLREGVREVIHQGYQNVILDFNEVNYMDSSGLGELVAAHEFVKEQGGKLLIVQLQKKVKNLLYVSLLIEKLDCFPNKEEAMEFMLAPQV